MTSGILVVVPTLGRTRRLELMLGSLARQSLAPDEVVLAVHGDVERVRRAAGNLLAGLRVRVVEYGPSASRARNTGVRQARPGWRYVVFADDDISYGEDFLVETVRCFGEGVGDALTAVILSEDGGPLRSAVPQENVPLTPRNIWKGSLEAGSAYTFGAWEAGGGFDEELGIGSAGPWQSGESTDLLLRLIGLGFRAAQCPGRRGTEATSEAGAANSRERARRARRYARGTGYVYRTRLGRRACLGLLCRSVLRVVVDTAGLRGSGRGREARQVLVGRVEGLFGRTLRPFRRSGPLA